MIHKIAHVDSKTLTLIAIAFIPLGLLMDLAHEFGHALWGIVAGGELVYLKIAYFQIYPNLALTTTFVLGYVEVEGLRTAFAQGLFILGGSLTTNIVAWLLGLFLLRVHIGYRKQVVLKTLGFFGILDLPLYVLLPQIGLQHWILLGENVPEPLIGARDLGIPDLAFYAVVVLTTLGLFLLYFTRFRAYLFKRAEYVRSIIKPLLYHQKQWATSTSSPSFYARQKPENPENSVPSQADPKKRRKTPNYHAEKAYLEEVEE
jgi:hypothetical protein